MLLVLLVVAALAFAGYVVSVSSLDPPEVDTSKIALEPLVEVSEFDRRIGENHLFLNEYGNWELYVEGSPYERGLINGKLCSDLLYQQEKAFTDQIQEMVPNPEYLNFLKYFVGFFNRNMNKHVTDEYQREIFGVSRSAPDTFDFVSDKYDRMMNYHAAHDIGHALQNLALVGCTSFSADDAYTADGELLLGRNFDFYVGDGFAKNKMVALMRPDSGYAFLSITWAGMIGVVSGMNEKGLTITLNAAPSEVPMASATPISILAREILQYAETIDEALEIAKKRKTFVSESLMISSAKDGQTALIEKTPKQTALYRSTDDLLVCSNHFQSELLASLPKNQEARKTSDTDYRYNLMSAMLDTSAALTPTSVVTILRNRNGLAGDTLGLGNPLAINQLIAHHGVVFSPEKRLVWVSSNPYQLGAFAAYDLNEIFGNNQHPPGESMAVDSLTIPESPFIYTDEFQNFQDYRKWLHTMGRAISNTEINFSAEQIEEKVATNPYYYLGYKVAAEYWMVRNQEKRANAYLQKALTLKIPYDSERREMEEMLKQIDTHGH